MITATVVDVAGRDWPYYIADPLDCLRDALATGGFVRCRRQGTSTGANGSYFHHLEDDDPEAFIHINSALVAGLSLEQRSERVPAPPRVRTIW